MNAATCAVFFCSGAAALLFETLWFRQAGLLVGNTVWASALVTAAFMAGLALGNAFAIRRGGRLARPLRAFALLELVVASTGLLLVLALPHLGSVLAPLFARLTGAAIDATRLLVTFAVLCVPASAMGATLPVLARSLGARDANFGRLLGRLYGWNTLGAVSGALIGEWVLIRVLGVAGTGLAAAGLDVAAAGGAWLLDRRQAALTLAADADDNLDARATRLAATAFLAGGLLLALEVVWFRLLLLFVWATSGTFAVLLAVVLLGIGAGGLLASAWLGRRPGDARHASALAAAATIALVASYAGFDRALPPARSDLLLGFRETLLLAAALMFPVCSVSGMLFAFLGHSLRAQTGEDSRAAGVLTLANTVGAMLGALGAGFVLLPFVGIENSLFGIACGYAGVAALAHSGGLRPKLATLALVAVALSLFPFGSIMGRHIRYLEARWQPEGFRVAAVKEGLGETVFLLRKDALGRPLTWRLLTNGMGMSTTDYRARRYMGLFVWLPLALHPQPRSALVISYGLGNTARTLAATRELERIDVVDVSDGVLGMTPLVWPAAANPLRDTRVRIHVEDGRFYLLTSSDSYDLITGEPPPPKAAGIGALYSREYFRLMRARLAEGGIATYWLPVLLFEPREAFAVVRGFCDVFDDCSLWTGFGHQWMLVGTRSAHASAGAARFAAQWDDPLVAARLGAAGLASPAQLGATFLADAAQLGALTPDVPPLVDDRPYRLDPRRQVGHPAPEYAALMETTGARRRFQESAFVRRLWPAQWIDRTLDAFARQAVLNRHAWRSELVIPQSDMADLAAALTAGDETLALWMLGSSVEEQELAARAQAEGFEGPELRETRGLGALAARRFAQAETMLAAAEPQSVHAARLRRWRILAAALANDRENAARLLRSAGALVRASASDEEREAWSWLSRQVGLALPAS